MSSTDHAGVREIDLYVIGALDAPRVEAFERHAATCDACAAALAEAARLELAFETVANREERARVVRPRAVAAAYGAAGVVAMAAAVMLWIGHSFASIAPADGVSAAHGSMQDGAILDARSDALDGG